MPRRGMSARTAPARHDRDGMTDPHQPRRPSVAAHHAVAAAAPVRRTPAWHPGARPTASPTRNAPAGPSPSTSWRPTGRPEARLAGLLDLLADTVGAERRRGRRRRRRRGGSPSPRRDPTTTPRRSRSRPGSMPPAPRSRARRAAAAPATCSSRSRTTRRAERAPRRARPAAAFYACLPIPSAGEVTLGFSFARPDRSRRPSASACRRPSPGTRPSPWPSSTERWPPSASSVALRAGRGERDRLRLDRGPRAAHAADRPVRLPRPDPRRPGRRPGGRARVPRARAGRSSPRWTRWSATCWSCPGSSRARSALESGPFSVADALRRGRSRACCRSPSSAASGSHRRRRRRAADRDGRPAAGRADPHQPHGQRAQVRGDGRPGRADRSVRGPGRGARGPRRGPGHRRRGPRPDLRALLPDGRPRAGHRHRARACPSRATWPGRWAASSTSPACPASGRASCSSCPVPARPDRARRCIADATAAAALEHETDRLRGRRGRSRAANGDRRCLGHGPPARRWAPRSPSRTAGGVPIDRPIGGPTYPRIHADLGEFVDKPG